MTPGWPTLWAVLVNNDHMPFIDPTTCMLMPGTFATISLFVRSSAGQS
jgi:hypothetical protein